MRFMKGSRVEVFSNREDLTDEWLCPRIIHGNGHTYSVKYDSSLDEEEAVVDRVPRKIIRSSPPNVQGEICWVPGDLVEVFDNSSWKTAAIVKVIGADNFLVRMLGLSKSLLVYRSYIRARQQWKDGKWIVQPKGKVEIAEGRKSRKIKQCIGDDYFNGENNGQIRKQQTDSTIKLKRKLSLGVSDDHKAAPKKRLIDNCGSSPITCSVQASPLLTKVDSIVYRNVNLGENVYSYYNNATAEFSRMDAGCGCDSSLVDSTTISVHNDECSSSVGSCSSNVGYDPHNLPSRVSPRQSDNIGDYCSDAESSSELDHEKERRLLSSNEQMRFEFHRSELHKYCSIVEDLYALGPLNWEEEAKLTKLRYRLHISDDEHLKVIRNLISAKRMPF